MWNAQCAENTKRTRVADLRAFGAFCWECEPRHVDPVEAAAYLVSLGPLGAKEAVLAWDADAIEREAMDTTRSRRIATLKSFVAEFAEDCELRGLPSWKLHADGPTVDPFARAHGPEKHRVEAVLADLERDGRWRDRAIVLLCLDAGLRTSEVATLRVEAVDLPARRAMVTRKGGKIAPVPFSKRAADALRRAMPAHGYVFPGADGNCPHLTRAAMWALGTRLGIGGLHGLRHTAATELARRGVSIDEIRRFLGHKSIVTTQRYIDAIKGAEGRPSAILAGEDDGHENRN